MQIPKANAYESYVQKKHTMRISKMRSRSFKKAKCKIYFEKRAHPNVVGWAFL